MAAYTYGIMRELFEELWHMKGLFSPSIATQNLVCLFQVVLKVWFVCGDLLLRPKQTLNH